MSVKRILVTGGGGFIGSHIVENLLQKGCETFVLDNFSSGSLDNLKAILNNPLLHVIEGDISEIHKESKDLRDLDIVYHEAGIASVKFSVTNPSAAFQSNVASTMKVLDFCVDTGVKRIIFASSSAVYGDIESENATTEEVICKPTSPYGASKLSVENYLYSYWKTYGLEPVSLRYFNVYGPRQNNNDYSGVITTFINRLRKNQAPVIYGDGLQVRDFVHIQDLVEANMLSMESKDAVGQAFNVGTGIPTTIFNLAEILKKILSKEQIKLEFTGPRIGDIRKSLPSISKVQNLLGYRPKVNLQTGLKNFVGEIIK